jgi:hypothetical protein
VRISRGAFLLVLPPLGRVNARQCRICCNRYAFSLSVYTKSPSDDARKEQMSYGIHTILIFVTNKPSDILHHFVHISTGNAKVPATRSPIGYQHAQPPPPPPPFAAGAPAPAPAAAPAVSAADFAGYDPVTGNAHSVFCLHEKSIAKPVVNPIEKSIVQCIFFVKSIVESVVKSILKAVARSPNVLCNCG